MKFRTVVLSVLLASFIAMLMTVDTLMIHFSFHATTYEFPLLGVFPIWTAWQMVFAFLAIIYFLTFLVAMDPRATPITIPKIQPSRKQVARVVKRYGRL